VAAKKVRSYSDNEKALVGYFKEQLKVRGILKFPRDWHLKQLAMARNMLAGENAPSLVEWKACIEWAFSDAFWGDKMDHLARVENLWAKYMLQAKKKKKASEINSKEKSILQKLYFS